MDPELLEGALLEVSGAVIAGAVDFFRGVDPEDAEGLFEQALRGIGLPVERTSSPAARDASPGPEGNASREYSDALRPFVERDDRWRAGPPPPPIRRKDADRLGRYVRQVARGSVVDLQASYDLEFLEAAQELTQKANRERWGRARFVGEMEDLATSYGASGFRANHAETWYRTVILNGSYTTGQLVAFNAPPTRRLFPYLALRDQGDERVRANHHALDGFVAEVDWEGWRRLAPPLGWNCRCQLRPVSAAIARELGWTGRFPRGDQFLAPQMVDGELVTPGRDSGFGAPLILLEPLLPF